MARPKRCGPDPMRRTRRRACWTRADPSPGVCRWTGRATRWALQGVTHVIRGHDLFEAAHIQRLIQALMGWPAPVYRHHRLLTGPDGRRYAKRDRSQPLAELRAGGMTAEALRADLGFD